MSKELFEGVDINLLANSEGAILDKEGNSVKTTTTPAKVEKKEDKDDDNKNDRKDEGLDVDKLAELDETSSLDTENEDTDDNKKIKKNTAPGSNTGTDSPSSQSALTSLASALYETGALSSLEKEEIEKISDTESLLDAIAKQIKSNEYADLNDDQKAYLKAVRDGVPHETYAQRKSNAEQYKAISEDVLEENEALCVELIKRSFIIKGIDVETASKYAAKVAKDDDVVGEAVKAKNLLVKHEEDSLKAETEKREKDRELALKAEKDQLDSLKSKINETTELFPGIKVNSQTKEKIFSSMVTPTKNKDGKLQNEVMDLYSSDAEYKMKLHALHILTKGFTDFTKFKNTAKSNAVKELEDKLNSSNNGLGAIGTSGKHPSQGAGMTSRQIVDALPSFGKK